ncbi:alanine--tRNA ligase [Flavihumibacter petaseus]|uniref:Alanine--tRNA ligase n=1 Tax=Flavihumibacter petaseus NBRC 106054 TaxID=1220578 RepID=A0A0E9MWJ1_9BACT|nr:alanine--tRNA ligase [Flavihumibacter petaseus]GAO41811.1 alanyl-tRNA synthetase [Flavihumibacter petaseus NBRC 106054]
MRTSAEIRQSFLDFFASKGHTIVPSAPIVVKNDPTLLFTNAGMNQFKDFFLGNRVPPSKRVADTQKCLRVSGKHNDLEEVGVDTYHHTMFEMLGNWSFGDYFKKDAIAWSWELLTAVLGIDKDRIYVTVFEGDAAEHLPKDEEAYEEWKKWIAEDRILTGSKKDNFWEMGDTGPCGPCTEIHVDCRPDTERAAVDGKTLVNNDHPQVIEIWNNVFMQFNRLKDKSLTPLPAQHVDTGMGFERLVRVLQNKQSNYDTDIFTGTIATTAQLTGKQYGFGDSKSDVAFRVLADHIRAIAFTIADGQLPSNKDAGYVIRRILRRAVRYYYSYLDYKQPLLHQLLPGLAKQFEHVFPELINQQEFVAKVIREEEEAFLRTLDKGLRKMDDVIQAAKNGNQTISGAAAFELYDTFGFPIDLSMLIAAENAVTIDKPGFDQELLMQKDRSRQATAIDTEDWVILSNGQLMEFVGYDSLEISTKVLRYRKVKAKGKESFQLVLAATPFYAESGGQVGDTGTLSFMGEMIQVVDTKKENDLIVHFVSKLPVNITAPVVAKVEGSRRKKTEAHHSATHLLHAALRQVLGNHVVQKGSLVNDEHLRFDFAHFSKPTESELAQIEAIVNEKIRCNIPVEISEMPKEDALKLGAMALFGEKYSDIVRVVVMDKRYSVELCGGTHVSATGELGTFKLKHEAAVAAGVRRIEAVAGTAAETWISTQLEQLHKIREVLKHPADIVKAAESAVADNQQLRKQLEALEQKALNSLKQELLTQVENLNGTQFLAATVEVSQPDALKKLCFDLKAGLDRAAIVLATTIGDKAYVAISFSDLLVTEKGLDAGKLIKEVAAPLIKGGGGGQKALATAGGQDSSRFPELFEALREKASQ